jgi:hypothetical protein
MALKICGFLEKIVEAGSFWHDLVEKEMFWY